MRYFLSELKRRRVFRVAAAYAVITFVLLQAADLVLPALLLPDWTYRLLVAVAIFGFPVAIGLAWAFDITPEGVRRTEPAPPKAARQASRGVAWAGVGMLIALVGFGAFAYLGPDRGPADRGSAAGERESRAIAVLPFQNLSADAENEYFADGITEDILSQLALVPAFAVISRTSVMRYKGSDKGVPEIARELGVDYVLEGSVRRAGQDVRIVAQLIEARTDEHLWAETYDRRLEHIFAVQTEIAQAISAALRAQLTRGVEARMERPPTADLTAYDLFLFGREQFYRYDLTGVERAVESFREAIGRDPGFALAHAWLGRALAIYAYNLGAGADWGDSAVVAARRAVRLDPDLAEAHTALGTALAAAGRLSEAVPEFERALELNPNDWVAMGNLGVTHAIRGQLDEAIRLAHASLRREPARSIVAYGNLASWYSALDLRDRADDALARAQALDADYAGTLNALAWSHIRQGDLRAAAAAAERLVATSGDQPSSLLQAGLVLLAAGDLDRAHELLGRAYALSPTALAATGAATAYGFTLRMAGERDRADAIFDEFERYAQGEIAAGSERSNLYYPLVAIYALRGDAERAIRNFERAAEMGYWNTDFIRRDPTIASLRDDPRFLTVLQRMDQRLADMRARIEREAF